jgi:putative endonuclease
MFYAYILRSLKDHKYYYGHASNLDLRLKQHNYGKVIAANERRSLILHYSEVFSTKTEAIKRELFFKSIDGDTFLKENKII